MNDWIVLWSVSIGASFVHCLLGFGDALLTMPFLLMFYSLEVADTIANNYAFIIGVVLTGYSFKHLKNYKWESISLFIGYTIFTIVGLAILEHIDPNAIIVVLACLLIFYPLMIFFIQKKQSFALSGKFAFFFGAISGMLGATTTINGPALVMYGQLRKYRKETFIAVLQPIFLWGSILNFYGYYKIGLFNPRLTLIMLASTPFILVNAYICKKIRNKINQKVFTILVATMIFIAGVMMLVKHL